MKDNAAKIVEEVMSVCEKIKKSNTLNGMIKKALWTSCWLGGEPWINFLWRRRQSGNPHTSKLQVQPLSKRMRYCGEVVLEIESGRPSPLVQ
jgi:hypothetical protein